MMQEKMIRYQRQICIDHVDVVGFKHTDLPKKEKSEFSCQCVGLELVDKQCSTTDVKSVFVQTYEESLDKIKNVDMIALNTSLKKCLEILKNDISYWPFVDNKIESNNTDVLQDVFWSVSLQKQLHFSQKKISAISWNCSGDNLAVATSQHNHLEWCNHLNFIFVYSMTDIAKNKNIIVNKIEVTSCINCLATHPTNEHLITAGLFNGEILICNTEVFDGCMNIISLDWHTQVVTESLWFIRSDFRAILVTSGNDGYICVGIIVDNNIKLTQRLYRYLIGLPDKIGIQCFDFSERHFVTSLQNGKLSCYLSLTGKNKKEDVIKPVAINDYQGNSLMTECIKLCSKDNDLFAVTQFDYSLLLYNINQKSPIKIFYHDKLITKVLWSLDKEYLVYIGTENGEIATVDITKNITVMIKKISDFNVISMKLNKRNSLPLVQQKG
ncbi:cytoplasmic dynein 2 intermediate chain 2-like isoform X2 [Daktulosphaira vitifoliae]|uniref:cytoplasmic dynein 2 intermediate chain 2-like isoform X2 n=1 Tax=Daktulosphaira vitifoliae TaxID=58002 RepID=UPI0021AAFF9A|nr:cytoplasmic dynein 2 intermediate chain 2-like isoform X2 [Daktulosphaira vitifoliae]